jgi:hypothetical protein
MKKIKLIIAVLAVSVMSLGFATTAGATANTKLDLLQDCSTGCPQPPDMVGPAGFGFVNYNQDANGDLRIVASLKGAEPNTTYVVILANGPTHATTTGFAKVGTVATNGQGNGTVNISVSHATLMSAPFGAGNQTNHIDLRKDVNDTSTGLYDATGVNYTVEP